MNDTQVRPATHQLDDRLEIHELLSRYYIAVDEHDADAWVALWTEEGVFDSGYLHLEGRAQLHQFMAGHDVQTRHLVTNVRTEVQGDRALAESYMLVVPRVDKPEVIATAHCRSELRKVDGRWKLTRHTYKPDPSYVPSSSPSG
jgi:ketosteroid isomerase-like protein